MSGSRRRFEKEYLRTVYEYIRREEPVKLESVMEHFSFSFSDKDLYALMGDVGDTLAEAGCVQKGMAGLLGKTVVYLPDPQAKDGVIQKIRAELLEDGELSEDIVALTALLQKSGLSEQEAQSLQQMIQGSTLTQETSVDVKKLFEAYSARNAQQNDVKASLNQTAQDDTAEEMLLDADALQAQMNLRSDALSQQMKMGQIAAVDKNAQSEEPIVKQVTQQMQLNLEKGSSEFTIRLRPENLGEITVKLVQKDGAMTLLLAADNENTKKLLNTNLEALREAVRPMQVEVREAVVQAQQSDGQDMSRQMDMSNGQFLGQQQAQQMLQDNSRHRANGVSWEAWLNGETDEEAAAPEQAVQAAKVIAENLMDVYF